MLAEDLKRIVKGEILADEQTLQAFSSDFGRMIARKPQLVVRPGSVDDVLAVLRLANERGFVVAARGSGHSQSGQSLAEGGVLLDMTSLNRIIEVDITGKTATCQGGVLWRDLVLSLRGYGLLPPVLTNNLNVTVGGTLSTAGLGIATFRYATQADNCLELEVVTGNGQIVDCSPEKEPELFYATLAGLGQFGIITKAKLALRTHKSHVRTYYLLYDDLGRLLSDLKSLMQGGSFDYLESWCVPCPQGFRKVGQTKQPFAEWFYPLHATCEFDARACPDDKRMLSGLNFYRHVHSEDSDIFEFVFRLEALFELWRRGGYWSNAHPWMETMLPWDAAENYIGRVLAAFPPHALGGGHILLWPARGRISKLPYFMVPDADFVMGFGILPGAPKEVLPQIVEQLALASDLSMAVGGKRYLSGLVQFDAARWQQHFGPRWSELKLLKDRYDPKRVLNRGFIPL